MSIPFSVVFLEVVVLVLIVMIDKPIPSWMRSFIFYIQVNNFTLYIINIYYTSSINNKLLLLIHIDCTIHGGLLSKYISKCIRLCKLVPFVICTLLYKFVWYIILYHIYAYRHIVYPQHAYFQQMTYLQNALGLYFVYDFCLLNNLSPLLSHLFRYIPAITATLTLIGVKIARWENCIYIHTIYVATA